MPQLQTKRRIVVGLLCIVGAGCLALGGVPDSRDVVDQFLPIAACTLLVAGASFFIVPGDFPLRLVALLVAVAGNVLAATTISLVLLFIANIKEGIDTSDLDRYGEVIKTVTVVVNYAFSLAIVGIMAAGALCLSVGGVLAATRVSIPAAPDRSWHTSADRGRGQGSVDISVELEIFSGDDGADGG